jgi:hypothetical protein
MNSFDIDTSLENHSEPTSIGFPSQQTTGAREDRLEEIFADLASFEVGTLSSLCISRDFFGSKV